MNASPHSNTIKDSETGHWVNHTPLSVRPYLQLSRLDRPVGYWLLTLPGWIGLAFATLGYGFAWSDLKWAMLIFIGAIAMRGAGCTYNDIVDQDLDAQVERTALRPLPAGTVTTKQAWTWVFLQCFIGLAVLLCLPRLAQIISLCSIPLVAAYPFMKRITWWPQIWLGLTFNWAVLVAFAAKTGEVNTATFLLYIALMFWTIGYDTIYACQDMEDDAMVGIKSTARRFGDSVKKGVLVCYAGCLIFIAFATLKILGEPLSLTDGTEAIRHMSNRIACGFLLLPFTLHLLTQVKELRPDHSETSLKIFKSNKSAAFLLIIGFVLATTLHYGQIYNWLSFTDTDLSVLQ